MQSLGCAGQCLFAAILSGFLSLSLYYVSKFLFLLAEGQREIKIASGLVKVFAMVFLGVSLFYASVAYKTVVGLVSPIKQGDTPPALYYLIYCTPALVLYFLTLPGIEFVADHFPSSWFAKHREIFIVLAFTTVAIVAIVALTCPWPLIVFDSAMSLFYKNYLCQTECRVISVEETGFGSILHCREGEFWLFYPAGNRDNLLSRIHQELVTVKYSPLTNFAIEVVP